MLAAVQPRTVADWQITGYRGLRIPSCPTCRVSTWASWSELDATDGEEILDVARRMRCSECQQPPAGLAVIASLGQ